MRPLRRFFVSAASAPQAARVRDRRPAGRSLNAGFGGSFVERLVAAVLDQAHAERPEHRLGRVAHEAPGLVAVVAVAVPAPRRDVDRVPGLPVVAHAVDLGPARALDDEEDRVPRMAMDGGDHAGIDLVHQRVEAARRASRRPSPCRRRCACRARSAQRHVFLADHAAAVLAPLLDELGAALLLDVVVRDGGRGFGRQGISGYMERRSRNGAIHHRIISAAHVRRFVLSFSCIAAAAQDIARCASTAIAAPTAMPACSRARQEGPSRFTPRSRPPSPGRSAQAFEKKSGIKVELWRALSEKVVQRAITEAQARALQRST